MVTSSTQSSKKKQELHAFKNRRDDSELNIVLARITTAFLVYISSNLQIHAAPAPIEFIKPQKPAADRRSAYRTAAAIENYKGRNSTT